MAVELIDGEAVVMPPSGAAASSVQGELFFALRSWQDAEGERGLLLQDVFVELPGHLCDTGQRYRQQPLLYL